MKDFKLSEDAEIGISKLTDQELEEYLSGQVNYALLVQISRLKRRVDEVAIFIFIASGFLTSITLSILVLI